MTTTDQQAVTVAQEDREAAAKLLETIDYVAASGASWVRDGHVDIGPTVQAFARHRLASVSSASAEPSVWAKQAPTHIWLHGIGDPIGETTWATDPSPSDDAEEEAHAVAYVRADLAASPEPVPATNQAGEVDIKQMVSRFLAWNLPSDFHPDAGITFKAAFNEHTEHPMTHEPTGTNLFTATQAEAMIRHLIDQPSPMKMAVDQDWLNAKIASDPDAECEAGGFSREWCLSMAAREGDVEIGAGSLDHPLRTAALATQPATSQEGKACEGSVMRAEDMVHGMGWCVRSGRGCYQAWSAACRATPTPPTLSEDLRETLVRIERAFREWDRDAQHASSALADVSAIARAALAQVKAS